MAELSCTAWDYESHPENHRVGIRCAKVLDGLRANISLFDRFGYSTLHGHKYIFRGMTPKECRYLAGNYRGANFKCLINYNVQIGNDPKVGTRADQVQLQMALFEAALTNAMNIFNASKSTVRPDLLLSKFVKLLATCLVNFLTIHPYANGNGHMARLMVWVLLGRFGVWPESWPLDASPSYAQAIYDHRRGNVATLENFILKCIIS